MILTDITKIVRVLLAAFEAVASQDELTQRRIGQIGEVIGAVEDVGESEAKPDETIAGKRVEEAHDIIHRIARILAMEEDESGGNEILAEVPWDGKMTGETIDVNDDENELNQ